MSKSWIDEFAKPAWKRESLERDGWKSELERAYRKIGWSEFIQEHIGAGGVVKENWISENPRHTLRCLPHLPKDWLTDGQMRKCALYDTGIALEYCHHLLPTDLLEECITKCRFYRYDAIAIGEAELARREQEFLVKTIQAL